MRPTASPNGATISDPPTCGSPSCASGFPASPCWLSQPRPHRASRTTSWKSCASRNPICCAAIFRVPTSLMPCVTPTTKTNSSCGSSATSAVPASSMSAPAKEPNRSRLSCATKVSPQNIITAGWDTPSARCGRKPGFRGVPPSWSLPMPSGWGSTSPTSATWYIIRCATRSKATIRRPDVPDATGSAAMPYC